MAIISEKIKCLIHLKVLLILNTHYIMIVLFTEKGVMLLSLVFNKVIPSLRYKINSTLYINMSALPFG